MSQSDKKQQKTRAGSAPPAGLNSGHGASVPAEGAASNEQQQKKTLSEELQDIERAAREAREVADTFVERDNTGEAGVSASAMLATDVVRACPRGCRFLPGRV